ncbi:DUF262 domain-containing protein [Aquimarina sp. AD1]|uniref:GmrSD restriction endonuclease domain-containing protein n=1 Tax=Aquimarina sp. (strain AD1) TaxID=1714848 RepID=UPI000E4FB94B|nr:DUF262 domain-containing protein [Aquimarina sp. AD1]AXT58197.1 DUF262 domain-containing protein [Aquimarina sp. AD1]RKN28062.1 DUF262 domain-containing protein [Aquimarina sp. AD1]
MSYIETFPVQHSTIMSTYSERDEIIVNPEYQRKGGVWTTEKKQLLIDSILNKYDIPKIYFHQFDRKERKESGKSFAIIDGKQRLETIWGFINGDFCLSNDIEFQDNPDIKLGGLSYDDLGKEYPKIKIRFDSFVLPIVGVMTDDIDLIEDMFFRLNEAVPLNSAEKRNAFGGNMVKAIREIANHSFFIDKVKFKNTRYQHMEVAARFLLVEISKIEVNKLIDTKKVYLDAMAKNYKTEKKKTVKDVSQKVNSVLDEMVTLFADNDNLLRAQGSMVMYYLLFKWAISENKNIKRSKLIKFEKTIKENRKLAEKSYEEADYDYLEYDRLSQHGTNDVSNIKERLRIITEYLE